MKNDKSSGLLILVVIGFLTIVVWQLPYGRLVLYPFTILGTWFHEMGHGLTAIVLGGSFHQLKLFPDGSGLAEHSPNTFLGGFGRALIAAGGPIGPSLAGSLFIISSNRVKLSRSMMFILSVFQVVSCILWIRSTFGFIIILIFGIVGLFISLKGSDNLQKFTLRFLGIQAIASLYLSVDYLFSKGGVVGGMSFSSDTAVISESLFLPYWFWAIAIIALSALLLLGSLVYVFQKKKTQG